MMVTIRRRLKNYLTEPDEAHEWAGKLARRGWQIDWGVEQSQFIVKARYCSGYNR